ncbi:response regulator [Sulfuricurvum sp. IAE1]|uniref:ATP-binding protein n=1 Tax=Sulfuricurvum sp. IAE1 TaxID=2546102 RepID=UPI00104533AB|nr:ATP-binding protein [Sulfuricurvum sp. IAE1]TDA67313.1 response regulator [Sulfuricurvum sp. IAE1]
MNPKLPKTGRDKRRPRPDIGSMVAAARSEAEKILNALTDGRNPKLLSGINPYRLVSILGDIDTLENSAPQAPIMRSEEYREIVDTTAFVIKTDAQGKILYANDLFCRSLGYDYADLIGRSADVYCHPDNLAMYEDALKSPKVGWSGEVKFLTKSGKELFVELRLSKDFDPSGNLIGSIAIHYDISDKILHRNIAKQHKELNSIILDEQPNIVAVLEKGVGIISLNRAFFKTFGFKDLNDFKQRQKSFFDIFSQHEDSCSIAHSKWWLDMLTGAAGQMADRRVKAHDADGVLRTFEVNAKILSLGKGSHLREYYIVSLNDITAAQKEADNAKEEANEAHRESYAKSSFLANMSHEIRTPLNGIIPVVELLEEGVLDVGQKEYVSVIKRSAQSLLSIINDILDFSKIETGAFEIDNIDFDLVEELESITDLFVAKAHEKGIDFCVFIDPQIPTCTMGDPKRIKQVVTNLVGNAIKFTESGEVSVAAELTARDESHITVRIAVKDTGIGIRSEDVSDIFNPFTQADNTISRKFGGTGLGLSISKNLVEMMGSQLQVESIYGEGSRFYFELDLPLCESGKNRVDIDNMHKTIGIYIVDNDRARRCASTLFRYLDSFLLNYVEIHNRDEVELICCDIMIVVSTGCDFIEWIDDSLRERLRIVSIVPANTKNRNRFRSDAVISMPINGSKIYDAILDNRYHATEDIHKIAASEPAARYNASVLVAEDGKTNRSVVQALLNRLGIEPVFAENGFQAVEAVKDLYYKEDRGFDIILMDIHMPVMGGEEATRQIIEHEDRMGVDRKTPIVALTADAIKGREKKYLDQGMSGFISKPIDRVKFDSVIATFLGHLKEVSEPVVSSSDQHSLQTNDKASRIAETLGVDVEIAEMLLDDFYANWREYHTLFLKAINENDLDEIARVAHIVKGSAGSLCFYEASEIAERIEDHAKERDEVDYKTMCETLEGFLK